MERSPPLSKRISPKKESMLSKPTSPKKSILQYVLDLFISPYEQKKIKEQFENLTSEQKDYIQKLITKSKEVLKMEPEKQREFVADFIRTLSKKGIGASKL